MWYQGEAGGAQGVWPMVAHRADSLMLPAELSYLRIEWSRNQIRCYLNNRVRREIRGNSLPRQEFDWVRGGFAILHRAKQFRQELVDA